MDNFREEVASKYNKTFDQIMYILVWIVIIFSGIIALMGLSQIMGMQFNVSSIGSFLIFGGITALLYWKKDELKVEYDYTFTNGDLDVGKVFGNSRRRLMTSLPMKNVEAAGMVADSSFNKYMNDNSVKKHNWFVNRDANTSYFYFVKADKKGVMVKHCIVLELSEEMLTMLKPYLKFGVWQGEKTIGNRF